MRDQYQILQDGQPSPDNQAALIADDQQHHIVPINEAKDAPPPRATYVISKQQMKRIRDIARLLATGTMIYDAASIFDSLDDMEKMGEDTLTKALNLSIEELFYIAPMFYAIPFFSINYNGIIDGIKVSVAAYHTQAPITFKSPFCGNVVCNYCHCCSNTLVFAIIFALGGFASFIEGIGGHFFVTQIEEMPGFIASLLGIICAIFVANTTLLTETPELFLAFCANEELLPLILEEGEELPAAMPQNPIQLGPKAKYASVLIGNTLRIFDGLVVAIEAYVYLVALTKEQKDARYFLFALGFLRSTTNFCFTGEKGVEAVDALFLKLSHPCPNHNAQAYLTLLKEIIIGIASLLPTILIMDLIRELYRQFLTDPDTQLPFPSPHIFAEIMAWMTAFSHGNLLYYSLYSNILLPAADWTLHQPVQFLSKIYNVCLGTSPHAQVDNSLVEEKQETIAEDKTPVKRKSASSTTAKIIELMDPSPRTHQPVEDEKKLPLLSVKQPFIFTDKQFEFLESQQTDTLSEEKEPQNPPLVSPYLNGFYTHPQSAPPRDPVPPSQAAKSICLIM